MYSTIAVFLVALSAVCEGSAGRTSRIAGKDVGAMKVCAMLIEVLKKTDGNEVDFSFCVRSGGGGVCSSRYVPACSSLANNCYTFQRKLAKVVDKNFPDVFGKVCVEPTGEQCVRTNVEYTTCKDDISAEDDATTICIPIKGGDADCADRSKIKPRRGPYQEEEQEK